MLQTREQVVAEFEMNYAKKVDEDAKILALKSIAAPPKSENCTTPEKDGTATQPNEEKPTLHFTKEDNSWTDAGAWTNQKGSKANKDAGKGWDAGKRNWNSCVKL